LIGKHRPIKALTIAFGAATDTFPGSDGRSDSMRRRSENRSATCTETLRVAQVRRISWVRRVGRLAAVGVASSKTPSPTGHFFLTPADIVDQDQK
jgi:hypothetical protein